MTHRIHRAWWVAAVTFLVLLASAAFRSSFGVMVVPIEDGPLLVMGDLDIRTPEGDRIAYEGRVTLCRCGLSRNQPFCDNSHLRRGWTSGPSHPPADPPPPPREGATDRPTRVVPLADASLELRGHIRVYDAGGAPLAEAGRTVLCRCGQSATKPFCDGSHERAEFRSRRPDVDRDRLEAETPAAFTRNERVPDARDVADGE